MIQPTTFAIHVTYTCPLACAHCCFSAGPTNNDRLPLTQILTTINNLDLNTIRLVAFTGGEPFVIGKELIKAVGAATQRGLTTRIVTSGYWAKSMKAAEKRLGDLAKAGLKELSISWDDFHEEFVSFKCVYNAFWAAKKLGLTVAINTVQAANGRWSADRIKQELGIPEFSREVICESPLNLTGRAKSDLQDAGLRRTRFIGPCPYVLTGPTLSAKNKLLACCGVIPETEFLTLDANFNPDKLSASMQRGLQSPLLNWIYLRGPYTIMEWISAKYGIPITPRGEVGGNCEACHRLFTTKNISEKIAEVISERNNALYSELFLLESLGLAEPANIMNLWADGANYIDTTHI